MAREFEGLIVRMVMAKHLMYTTEVNGMRMIDQISVLEYLKWMILPYHPEKAVGVELDDVK